MQLNSLNVRNVLFLIVSLTACWLTASVVRPELHYFLQQPAFLTESSFLVPFLKYPGGLADYMSEFISQFLLYNWLGSILIVLIAALMGLIAVRIILKIAGNISFLFSAFSLIVLGTVLAQANYHYPFYASVRLLLAFLFVWAYLGFILKLSKFQIPAAFLLAGLLFYIAGGAALLTFSVSVIFMQIHFMSRKTDWIFLPVFVLFAGSLPYLAYRFIFLVDQSLVYSITHAKTPKILFYEADFKLIGLYALLPLYVLISMVFGRNDVHAVEVIDDQKKIDADEKMMVSAKSTKTNKKKVKPHQSVTIPKKKIRLTSGYWLGLQFIVIAALAFLGFQISFDKAEREKILVSFYAANGEWDKVIEAVRDLDEYDFFANVDYNRALAAKGKLPESLFSYRQLAGSAGLFVDGAVTSNVPFINSDQYYDLGFMNESQHWTFEAQTIFPNSPRLMKRLVLINLVKGKYGLAEKFLDRLDQNMLYRTWVSEYRKYVEDTTLVMQNQDFAFKRKCEPKGEFTAGNCLPKLVRLVDANPGNKMAFDYLLSYFLLEGSMRDFVGYIQENRQLHYPLPHDWDQALVLYYYLLGKAPENPEVKVSRENRALFTKFVSAMKPYGNDWQSARNSLQAGFGSTYWYYLKCLSPKVTKVQIKKEKFNE